MVERKDGKSWGYRFYQAGKCYKKYASQWGKTEAANAEREKRVELKNNPPLPATALSSVAAAYLVDMAERGLSQHRINAVSYGLENHIIPHFGGATPIAAISSEDVDKLIKAVKKKGLKGTSTKNVFADFRACCNWAIGQKLLRENPTKAADRKLIGSTKVTKAPLDLESFDRAAASLDNEIERAWFDVTRFTGMRKDETNALQWEDVRFDLGMGRVPGTKTEGSEAWMPWAPIVMEILKRLYDKRKPGIPWVFPGRSSTTQGKKVYRRDPMFTRIYKSTGIKLRPKDLRDYFATVVAKSADANTLMRLMRHTSLDTTTKYMRTLHNSMVMAIKDLGASSGGGSEAKTGAKTAQNDTEAELETLRRLLVKYGNIIGNHGDLEDGSEKRMTSSSNVSEQTKH